MDIKDQRLLVVSGHAADYVWRAGGTIAKYIKHGAPVKVIVLSCGVRGESNDLWKQPGQTAEKVEEIRKAESMAAAKCLGIEDIEFWGLQDYYMHLEDDALIDRLAKTIREFKPYHIITHGPIDLLNPDHDAVNKFVFKASVLAISNGVKYEGYPTSKQTFKPEVIIDITETMEMKKAAMNCFKAQSHLIEYYGMKAFIRGNHARRISGCQDYKFAEALTRRFPYGGDFLV